MSERFPMFVWFAVDQTARHLTPNRRTTRRRVHAALIDSKTKADRVAAECQAYLDHHHLGSTARGARASTPVPHA